MKRGRGIAAKFEEQEGDVYFAEGRECKVETNGRTREEKHRAMGRGDRAKKSGKFF